MIYKLRKDTLFSGHAVKTRRINLFFTFVLFALDSLFFYLYVIGAWPFWLALGCHLALILGMWGVIYYLSLVKHEDKRTLALTGLLTTVLGPFGAFFSFLITALYSLYLMFSFGSQWEDDENMKKEAITHLYERIIYGMEDTSLKRDIISYQEVMTFGTDRQKRTVIEKILQYYQPDFYPVLSQALNNPSNSVRSHAATGLIRIDKKYAEQFSVLEKEVQDSPQPEAILRFAQHCDQYAHSHILDPIRQERMEKIAIENYERYLNFSPSSITTLAALAKLYLSQKDAHKAWKLLQRIIQKATYLTADIYQLCMQAAFELKDYEFLRHLDTELPPIIIDQANRDQRQVSQLANLWLEGLKVKE